MSSELMGRSRSRVLRGEAAAAVRGAALDADLSILRPGAGGLPPAETDSLREAREAAARVGYEDGYQSGRVQAAAEADAAATATRSTVAHALKALELAAAELTARQAVAVADVEHHIVDVGMAVAEAVLNRELSVATAPVRDAVVRALSLAPERGDVTVRLHPDDLAAIGDPTDLIADRSVAVIADPTVESGSCILDVGACRVDGQVATALRRVRQALQP